MANMTPREIVGELDRYIIGQHEAKRAVAIALRNRWRRQQVDPKIKDEITPKNILMIGPTGVGKTEIARRLAHLADAPFIKIEATKFTEVGYVGRDVESIIRDLAETAIKLAKEKAMNKVRARAADQAEDRILDAMLPAPRNSVNLNEAEKENSTRQVFRKRLREGDFDDKDIEIDIKDSPMGVEIMAPPGMEEMTSQLQSMFSSMTGHRTKKRKLKVRDAMRLITDEEAARLVNDDEIKTKALESVEQNGIVFIDEIDKVCKSSQNSGAEVSREGVQRDLLPLIEGSTVNTKFGAIKTDHILFIASGAFHLAKPSDLIPELQGRLPIRVELKALSVDDFKRILTEPDAAITTQYRALLATEDVTVTFTPDGVERIAEVAWSVNERIENIGARRLQTVMERLLEEVSFGASDLQAGTTLTVDAAYVNAHLGDLAANEDLSRYIL